MSRNVSENILFIPWTLLLTNSLSQSTLDISLHILSFSPDLKSQILRLYGGGQEPLKLRLPCIIWCLAWISSDGSTPNSVKMDVRSMHDWVPSSQIWVGSLMSSSRLFEPLDYDEEEIESPKDEAAESTTMEDETRGGKLKKIIRTTTDYLIQHDKKQLFKKMVAKTFSISSKNWRNLLMFIYSMNS